MTDQGRLNGLGVLVTRPEPQADGLCRLIEQHGGKPIRCPTLHIRPPHDPAAAQAALDHLATADLAIFTSVNAVAGILPWLQSHGGWPARLELAAIGQATARALRQHGATTILQPAAGFTSEALLELPRCQQVADQRIVLVCGEGGRTLLVDTLRARGVHLIRAEVYRRERPTLDAAALQAGWARGEIGAVTATSGESLMNLFALLDADGQDYLRASPLIVVSARIQQLAATLGCRRLHCARDASDAAILAALLALATPLPYSPR